MKERRKITFVELLVLWFCIALPLTVVNGFFIKIPILHNVIVSLWELYSSFIPFILSAYWQNLQRKSVDYLFVCLR